MSNNYTFNEEFGSYSPTTNLDQILQRRTRDSRNKSVYDRDVTGAAIFQREKKGVPLSDVWDIPFLNPKAKERTGYPTQKPVQLLLRLIKLLSNHGDALLDPFCGSGSSLVAAQELGRQFTGIDSSPVAVKLAQQRLENPIISHSAVLSSGRDSFNVQDGAISRALGDIECMRVQRNNGIDAIISGHGNSEMTFVKVQRPDETLDCSIDKLRKAVRSRGGGKMVVIQTHFDLIDFRGQCPDITIILSMNHSLTSLGSIASRSAA
jgi:site-specific DNA-methyltransferase (adenine-specific)